MPNYKEEEVVGQAWQRCYELVVQNPYQGTPTIRFLEESVVAVGGRSITTMADTCSTVYNANQEFDILDPKTGEPTGQKLTHKDLYNYLYSLYIKTATDRDARKGVPGQIV